MKIALALLFLVLSTHRVRADNTGAYRNAPNAVENNSDWMSELPDDALLSHLSLPGTHDSAASKFGRETTETQRMSISEQLKAGTRALDIRLGINHLNIEVQCTGPTLWAFHGISCQFQSFDKILQSVQNFLDDHPSEMVVMRIRKENGNIPDFSDRVESDMDSYPGLFYSGGSTNPELREARGQVVLLRDYGGSSRGIAWSSLKIQDDYRIATNRHLAQKWNSVRNQLIDANGISDDVYVNFLSASGGSFPYFVASGKSSWETRAPALLAGWTESRFGPLNSCMRDNNCIVEYYRTNCFLGVCSVAFKGINMMARDFIREFSTIRTGIVMADFPGPSLIGAIIDTNEFT